MEWFVYYYNMTNKVIEPYDIFKNVRLLGNVQQLLSMKTDKSEFAEEVRKSLFYYYASKSEYEVLISAWCGGTGKETVKVDIYEQVRLNWGSFIDYLWGFREHTKKKVNKRRSVN